MLQRSIGANFAPVIGGKFLAATAAAAIAGSAQPPQQPTPADDLLFVWARDADSKDSDFLAIVDLATSEVLATVPTGVKNSYAHHTEHDMPAGGVLFANGFGAGRTFLFDLSGPKAPRLADSFGDVATLKHAHSFARLPNGNVLTTYQMGDADNRSPGGLAEIAADGAFVRWSSATPSEPATFVRPYSLAVVAGLDRIVSTTSDMHATEVATTVQVWRLSDLKLLHTVPLPAGPRGKEHHDPAEPRVLADGKTVLVSTFNCGLFRLDGIDTDTPSAQLVHDFGTGECALPVVAGRYWVQTDTSLPGLVSLDISDPSNPEVTDHLTLGPDELPHWIALAPDGRRIVISGGSKALETKIRIATVDRSTGKLALAATPAIDFDRTDWPHDPTGKAIPHGAVFNRR